MVKRTYDDAQISEFIDISSEIGIGPAMRELGYPGSYHTAQKWYAERNMETPSADALFKKAADLKKYYSDNELMIAAQAALHRVFLMIETGELDADGLNKTISALQKSVQTIHLIQGKSTNINESHSKNAMDIEIEKLLDKQREKQTTPKY